MIRSETIADRAAVWQVNEEAFGSEAEAGLVDALRECGMAEVSLVAEVEGQLVGHILLSRVAIVTSEGRRDALALAPMAVVPSHQRKGIGSQLARAGLQACRDRGHEIVLVLGHPEFYSRFGFSADLASPLESPFGGGEAWMALETVPGALAGVAGHVEYSLPFRAFG